MLNVMLVKLKEKLELNVRLESVRLMNIYNSKNNSN